MTKSRSPKCRGFTLTEMLISAFLFLLAIGLAFGYLIPALKIAGRHREQSHMQQTALVALNKIEQAASTTAPGGFSWSETAPVALAFNPVGELQASNGILQWTNHYKVFWWDESRQLLLHRTWPPGPPAASTAETTIIRAKRLAPGRLAELTTPGNGTAQLAENVVGFSIEQRGKDGNLGQPIKVSLKLGRAQTTNSKWDQFTQTLTFRLVNQQ